MRRWVFLFLVAALAVGGARAQHEHHGMAHKTAAGVKLEVISDAAAQGRSPDRPQGEYAFEVERLGGVEPYTMAMCLRHHCRHMLWQMRGVCPSSAPLSAGST